MLRLPFYWIDAFTDKKFGGNPCAVVLDADALTVDQMQTIAKEMNLSETAFVVAASKGDFGARYFTPRGELPFAGHPTIAVTHALVQAGFVKPQNALAKLLLEVPAGLVPVEIEYASEQSKVSMVQMAPNFLRTYPAEKVLPIYGLLPEDLLPGAHIQTISTGSPILMIPLASHDALKRIKYIDVQAYENLKAQGDFLFAHHFCLGGATEKGSTFARSLDSPPGVLEDPFTGSATGCMAAYLWKYQFISNSHFLAEQGHWMGRPGSAEVELVGTFDDIQGVQVSGKAITVIAGTLEH